MADGSSDRGGLKTRRILDKEFTRAGNGYRLDISDECVRGGGQEE